MKRREFLAKSGQTAAALGSLAALSGIAPNPKQAKAEETKRERYYGGIVPVTVTPYLENHKIDPQAMESLAGHLDAAGCDGVFLAGSTGDMPFLSIPERETLTKAARRALRPETLLYVGVSDLSHFDIIENTKRLADAGADIAVLVAPLIYFCFSQEELTEYIKTIANNSPIPVFLYHHHNVKTPIEPETVRLLMDHPNIIGMKETGLSMDRTYEILKIIPGHDFFFMQGNEDYLPASYQAGAKGGISALAGAYPEIFVEIERAWRTGDSETFKAKTDYLLDLCNFFAMIPTEKSFSYFGYALKKVLQYRGWADNAYVRMPGFVPEPGFDKRLYEFFETHGFPKC